MSGKQFSNVWDAIESDPVAAENLKLRSGLMMALSDHIEREGLSQAQATKLSSSPSAYAQIGELDGAAGEGRGDFEAISRRPPMASISSCNVLIFMSSRRSSFEIAGCWTSNRSAIPSWLRPKA